MAKIKSKVIVLFPLYNGEETIFKSLKCIANQTFQDFRAIIVENHSTDNSLKIATEFAASDDRFEVIQNETHVGPIDSFLAAIQKFQADAEYLLLRAHDDFSAPNFLEKCIEVLDVDPEKHLAVSDVKVFSDDTVVQTFKYDPKLFIFKELLAKNKAPRRLAFTSDWFYGVYRCGAGTEVLARQIKVLGTPWCTASVVVAEFIIKQTIAYAPQTHFERGRISDSKNIYSSVGLYERIKRRHDYFMAIWTMRKFLGTLTFRQNLKMFEIAWRDARKKTGYYIMGM